LKWNKRLKQNRLKGSGEGSGKRKPIEKAVEEKDKEYKKVILKEGGLQDLEPKTEIKFDGKGFEDDESKKSD